MFRIARAFVTRREEKRKREREKLEKRGNRGGRNLAACFSLLFAIPRGARVSKHSFKTFASSTPSLPARRFRRQISRNRGETFTRRRTLCAAKDDPNSRFAASLFGFIFPLLLAGGGPPDFQTSALCPRLKFRRGDQPPGAGRAMCHPRPRKLFF